MSNKLPYLFTSLLLTILPGQMQAVDGGSRFESFTGCIAGNKVRMRAQPSLEGYVVRETLPGELFAVADEKEGFYAICPPKGTKGYLFRTFVLDGVVEGERVNIRLYPDTEAPIIGQLNRGDKINFTICSTNNKWLEIDLPENCHFYIAKEYVEKKGPVGLIAEIEKRQKEASHLLQATLLYAQAEIQKPFSEIDFDNINNKFTALDSAYGDLAEVKEKADEALELLKEFYIQRKIAFLEDRNENILKPSQIERFASLGMHIQLKSSDKKLAEIGNATSAVFGLSSLAQDGSEPTDKMLGWQPLEEALYHLWAVAHNDASMEQFYEEEKGRSISMTGIIEPYTRPVKNRPGDFLLRQDERPVAFLYSTRVNLEKLVGKKVTVVGSPRPNNHFAFDAYYVLSIE